MKSLTNQVKKERGWYYIGHDKIYWRDCDFCGKEYQGMGMNFCSRKCSANLKLVEKEDGTVTVALKTRSVGHNYGELISKAKRGKPNLKLRGANHFNWKGGQSGRKRYEREIAMCMAEYKEWRTSVFKRDEYKCVICSKGGSLQAHHIFNWTEYEDLRYDINNGVTVCEKHHPRGRENEKNMVETFSRIIGNKNI